MTRNGHRVIALFGGCALAAFVACQCVKLDEGIAYRCGDGGACDRTLVCIDGFCRLPPDAGTEDGGEDSADAAVAWTFENPLSGGRDLYAVHGGDPNDVLAVGERGVALRWNGVRWAVVDLGVETELEGVMVSATGKAYVVGDGGTVLYWNGITWTALPVPSARPYHLHAVSGSPTTGPAVLAGDRQTIDTVNPTGRSEALGGNWILSDGGYAALYGIWSGSTAEGWAVGEEGAVFKADTLGKYYPAMPRDGGTLNAVYGFTGYAWMVGERGRLLRAIPTAPATPPSWDEVNLGGGAALRAITGELPFGATTPRLWVVGERGAIFRSDGGGYEAMDAGVHLDLRGVYSPRSDEVWAVGGYGTIVKYDKGSWHDVIGGVTRHLHGIADSKGDDLLAVGDDMTVLLRADGGWAPVYQNPDLGNAVAACGNGEGTVWVVGDTGSIVRLESNEMKDNVYTFTVLRDVTVVGPGAGQVWAVGGKESGAIFSSDADGGRGWEPETAPGKTLSGIWGTTLADLRVVATDGTIYRRGGGGAWLQELPPAGPLNSIWGSGPNDIWAVGSEGAVAHWTGSSWSTSSLKKNLFAVRGRSATDVWAVGAGGAIVRWNGFRWLDVPSPTTRDLTGIAFGDGGTVWVVGADGTILSAVP